MTYKTVDCCLHQILRLRLIDASPADIATVERQSGLTSERPSGSADLCIRFTDETPDRSTLRILGDWEAGHDHQRFWMLRGRHGQTIAVQLPLDEIGGYCEIRCLHGLPSIPLLQTILNLTALGQGFLPLHASAVLYQGQGTLVTGWAKGGKTESLLGFAEQNASYVGDEWIYLSPDDGQMYGLGQPIQLWDWHVDSPHHRTHLRWSQRLKLMLTRRLYQLSRHRVAASVLGVKNASRVSEWIHRRRHVRLTPGQLFGSRIQTRADAPRKIFLVASHARQQVQVRPIPITDIVSRMAISLEDEFSELLACYRQYRFAFPERRNARLDQLPATLLVRLQQVFADKEGYVVWHPYPVATRLLYKAIRPYVADAPAIPNSVRTSNLHERPVPIVGDP
jgi:hypothetical protein